MHWEAGSFAFPGRAELGRAGRDRVWLGLPFSVLFGCARRCDRDQRVVASGALARNSVGARPSARCRPSTGVVAVGVPFRGEAEGGGAYFLPRALWAAVLVPAAAGLP